MALSLLIIPTEIVTGDKMNLELIMMELPLQFPLAPPLRHLHRRRIHERGHRQGNHHGRNPHLKVVKQVIQQHLNFFNFLGVILKLID